MGRRWYRKVTQDGTVTQHECYLYRGALQIAALDMLQSAAVRHTLLWDPASGQATEPLALTTGGSLYLYGIDFGKNVSELMNEQGQSVAVYDYAPYGSVTSDGELAQVNPLQWSSEVFEPEQALSYYNYRHYAPLDGRWISRDPVGESASFGLYMFVENSPVFLVDVLGLAASGGGSGAGESSGGNCCCKGKPMGDKQCCCNEKPKDPEECKIRIVVGHSNGKDKNPLIQRIKMECKNKYDRVGVVSCYQAQTAELIPRPNRYDNTQRTGTELPKGAPAIEAMNAEVDAATAEAQNKLCKSKEKCCASVTISLVSVKGAAGQDLADFQTELYKGDLFKEHPELIKPINRQDFTMPVPVTCERDCTERGGVEL